MGRGGSTRGSHPQSRQPARHSCLHLAPVARPDRCRPGLPFLLPLSPRAGSGCIPQGCAPGTAQPSCEPTAHSAPEAEPGGRGAGPERQRDRDRGVLPADRHRLGSWCKTLRPGDNQLQPDRSVLVTERPGDKVITETIKSGSSHPTLVAAGVGVGGAVAAAEECGPSSSEMRFPEARGPLCAPPPARASAD